LIFDKFGLSSGWQERKYKSRIGMEEKYFEVPYEFLREPINLKRK
jgi:hypothetical protein